MSQPGMRAVLVAALVLSTARRARAIFSAALTDYNAGRYDSAHSEFLALAELGDCSSQFNLGAMALKGQGGPQDTASGVGWLEAAAGNGCEQLVGGQLAALSAEAEDAQQAAPRAYRRRATAARRCGPRASSIRISVCRDQTAPRVQSTAGAGVSAAAPRRRRASSSPRSPSVPTASRATRRSCSPCRRRASRPPRSRHGCIRTFVPASRNGQPVAIALQAQDAFKQGRRATARQLAHALKRTRARRRTQATRRAAYLLGLAATNEAAPGHLLRTREPTAAWRGARRRRRCPVLGRQPAARRLPPAIRTPTGRLAAPRSRGRQRRGAGACSAADLLSGTADAGQVGAGTHAPAAGGHLGQLLRGQARRGAPGRLPDNGGTRRRGGARAGAQAQRRRDSVRPADVRRLAAAAAAANEDFAGASLSSSTAIGKAQGCTAGARQDMHRRRSPRLSVPARRRQRPAALRLLPQHDHSEQPQRARPASFASFGEFYPYYLEQHCNRCRAACTWSARCSRSPRWLRRPRPGAGLLLPAALCRLSAGLGGTLSSSSTTARPPSGIRSTACAADFAHARRGAHRPQTLVARAPQLSHEQTRHRPRLRATPVRARQQRRSRRSCRAAARAWRRSRCACTPDGSLAHTPHPRALGSALTNEHITTDYSEALIELVTPAFTAQLGAAAVPARPASVRLPAPGRGAAVGDQHAVRHRAR